MSGRVLLLRSHRDHPRFREGARKDERRWVESLNDRELAKVAAELYAVDKAVKNFNKSKKKDAA